MIDLTTILKDVSIKQVIGLSNVRIKNIKFDSREVGVNDLFVAIKGTDIDGHLFLNQVIEKGVKVLVLEKIPEKILEEITYIVVESSIKALGLMAKNFYKNPSNSIKLIGVTGTNGKTTTVRLLFQLFKSMGFKVGMISTIDNRINDKIISSSHTTPDILTINKLLSEMKRQGCLYCFMEVSSHAISQNRVFGLNYSIGVFTNLTKDHLDYHKTFKNYINTKKSFFSSLSKESTALVNEDDKYTKEMISDVKSTVLKYSLTTISDFNAKVIEKKLDGMLMRFNKKDVWTKLTGKFNAFNLLSVFGVAKILKFNDDEILKGLSYLNPIQGRFQFIRNDSKINAIVDYAHTEDALRNVLTTINSMKRTNQNLITVLGCGGNRDTSKRPIMAKIATDLSQQVILTSDNPRFEEIDFIIEQMLEGISNEKKHKTIINVDRKEAIKEACFIAKPHDIILVAGKGHEKFQEIKGVKYPFDDKKELFDLLNKNT